jgi:hypothetical protein
MAETKDADEKTGVMLATASADDQLVVFAKEPVGIALMQAPLIEWFSRKIEDEKRQLADLEQNLEIAKKAKHGTAGWKREVSRQKKRVEYYEKGKTVLEAGYWMVPDFPADIFAVRTTRKKPPKKEYAWEHNVSAVESNSPPAGEGEYVDSTPFVRPVHHTKQQDGKEKPVTVTRWVASGLDTMPEFPLKTVKPQVVAATTRAMKLKVFDEIGILPERTRRRGDPMVIGKIKRKVGYTTHTLNFIICWWLDTRAL